ncbi:M16 family metallopeptidase [Mesonia sp. K7]|uniref:M16 family metallopeptidase n=1 Tax=Mesonia sp. K7 TaxID=2218606 RepID=UPI000DA78513|nr:insulinase family protein [Mesonia sp. K7]PZD76444.1 hypothetical protein DNG35_12000 [Mesonia sp. K7]
MKTFFHLLCSFILLLMVNYTIRAKAHTSYSLREDTLAQNTELRKGQLPNGLTYYIKPVNDVDKLHVYLYIKAGSHQEEADQFTFAHFMEHLVLKAGKHVSKKMVYDSELFNAAGLQPRDITAHTSDIYTQFSFVIPPQEKGLDVAFLLYNDILWDQDFKQEYIDSERAPFLEEMEIKGGNSSLSFMESYLDKKIIGCYGIPPANYSNHIWQMKRESLLRYYDQWYRPENASLVILGNIENIDTLEKKIKQRFSKTDTQNKFHPTKDCNGDYRSSLPKWVRQKRNTLLKETTAQQSHWRLYMRTPTIAPPNSIEALQTKWVREIIVTCLNEQLKQLTQKYNTHYFATAAYRDLIGALQINIGVTQQGEEKRAIQEVMGLLKTLHKNGISSEMFEELKSKINHQLQQEKNTGVTYWQNEIKKQIAYGELLLDNKKSFKQEFISQLSLVEFNRALEDYLKKMPEDIGVIASEKHLAFSYSENKVRSWMKEAKPIQPKSESEALPLLTVLQKNNLKLGEYQQLESGIPQASEYVLKNGVRFILRPYQPAPSVYGDQDHIRIHGFSKKGAKCYPKEDYYAALYAPEIVRHSGVAGRDKFALSQNLHSAYYKGTFYNYIRPYETGVYVNTPIDQLETALQLIYLYFIAPNYNPEAFKDWKVSASYKYLSQINQDDFIGKIKQTLKDPYLLPSGSQALEGIAQTDLDRAYQIYQELFGNAEGYTFLFSGNFQEDEVLGLCRKYLGNLPVSQSKTACSLSLDSPRQLPKIERTHEFVAKENAENTRVKLVYLSPLEDGNLGWKDEIKLNIFYYWLQYTLIKEIRNKSKEGGPYTIGVGNYNLNNPPRYKEVALNFGGRPQDIDRLLREIKVEIENIQNANNNERMFQTALQKVYPQRERLTNLEIQKEMYGYARYGKGWVSIPEKRAYINSLTSDEVLNFSEEIVSQSPYIFKLLPNPYE